MGNMKSITIRFNFDDEADSDLYQRLSQKSHGAISISSAIKRLAEKALAMDEQSNERERLKERLIAEVRDQMQYQVTKIMGAILAGISAVGNGNGVIGTGGAASMGEIAKEQELPSATEEFPEELDSILDMFG